MKEALKLRAWAGPLTIGTFAVVAVTGVFMFFHLNSGLSKAAHEIVGFLLVVGVLAHLAVNWKPFLAYFRKPFAVSVIMLFLVLGGLSFISLGGGEGHPPFMEVVSALENSSLNVVAQVAKSSPQELMSELKDKGIKVESPELTIAQISAKNGKQSMEVLMQIMNNP